MVFKKASEVSSILWQSRTAEYPRSRNRAYINNLYNGGYPYTDEEVAKNNININFNFLEGTRLAHDARSQFGNGFLKPGNYFVCKTDSGPKHSREKYSSIVTKEINKIMKRRLDYFECMRSKFALLVLHGIGPATWENSDAWCPISIGIDDLLIPGNTKLTFKGLPFFGMLKSFTAPDLIRMTRGKQVDPGWNIDLVNQALKYIDTEAAAFLGTSFPDIWSPEKSEERIFSYGAYYAGDSVPTLDCYDFYYWSDEDGIEGWRRRIVIDDWKCTYVNNQAQFSRNDKLDFGKEQWLYDSGSKVFADKRESIFSCQFADLSAVAPFQYHSVRSLGFLMYGICQLQNRLRCKFTEAVFEALTMLFRVKTGDDVQRALKLELINQGFIDDTISPVPASDRMQVNWNLVQLGLQENQRLIQDNASSYTQNTNNSRDGVEKTRYQVMAEVNAMASLVSAALTQAYQYQNFENIEIFRRFTKPNSTDADVKEFRASCLRQGVPEKILIPQSWEIEPEQILGGGNLTRETAIAEWLMQHYDRYEPESQRKILQKATFSVTGDPGLADTLVPEKPQISSTVSDTQRVFGTLMQGIWIDPAPGLNSVEAAAVTISKMKEEVVKIMQSGGVGNQDKIIGLGMAYRYAMGFIQMLSKDKMQAQIVRQLGDELGKVMNEVKGIAQRQQEMAQKAAQQNGAGGDPESAAKVQSMLIQAQTKSQLAKQSHAEKTAQRQVSFEQKLQQDAAKHQADMAKLDIETAQEIQRERMKPKPEPGKE